MNAGRANRYWVAGGRAQAESETGRSRLRDPPAAFPAGGGGGETLRGVWGARTFPSGPVAAKGSSRIQSASLLPCGPRGAAAEPDGGPSRLTGGSNLSRAQIHEPKPTPGRECVSESGSERTTGLRIHLGARASVGFAFERVLRHVAACGCAEMSPR